MYKDAFKEVLKDAVLLVRYVLYVEKGPISVPNVIILKNLSLLGVHIAFLFRDPSIRSNVGRILKIWEERKVYDPEFMEEILSLLSKYHEGMKVPLSLRLCLSE